MAVMLTLSSVIMLLCILCNKISNKIGVPTLLIFILLGMFFGIDGIFKIPFENYSFTEQICSTALIFIMFYGGFGTNWKAARPVAVKAVSLSTLGVLLTAGLVGLFCHYVLGFGWLTGMLVGATISSTDAASVFSILRSRNLDLKEGTASLLEVESGSNDPCSYMMTMIFLTMIVGDGSQSILKIVVSQVVFGVLFGVVIALLSVQVLKRVNFGTDGFDGIFVVAVALLAYTLPTMVGGNGYLSTYMAGIIMGNQKIKNKVALVHFFDTLNGLAQIVIFFLLGLLAYPTRMMGSLGEALMIAVFLTFVARPVAVSLMLAPQGCSFRQQLLVSWAGLRGAASIVFAIMVVISGASAQGKIFDIVFCVVLFSIALQGTLLPVCARLLRMVEEDGNVFKTFNDYTEESAVQFIKMPLGEGHKWAGHAVRELALPEGVLLTMVYRGDQTVIPSGDTILLVGDVIILAAPSVEDNHEVRLSEIAVSKSHEWHGKPISQINIPPDCLIIMIRRKDGKTVVPKGNTVIETDDVLVMNGYTA